MEQEILRRESVVATVTAEVGTFCLKKRERDASKNGIVTSQKKETCRIMKRMNWERLPEKNNSNGNVTPEKFHFHSRDKVAHQVGPCLGFMVRTSSPSSFCFELV